MAVKLTLMSVPAQGKFCPVLIYYCCFYFSDSLPLSLLFLKNRMKSILSPQQTPKACSLCRESWALAWDKMALKSMLEYRKSHFEAILLPLYCWFSTRDWQSNQVKKLFKICVRVYLSRSPLSLQNKWKFGFGIIVSRMAWGFCLFLIYLWIK